MTFVGEDITGLASFQKCDWSYFSDICAVIPADNMVHFFDSRGNEIYPNTIKRAGRATCIAWSPLSDTLAIGWNDGGVSLWREGQTQESGLVLDSPINCLSWHPLIPLVLSTSETGGVCCWDCSTMILPLFKDQEEGYTFSNAEWVPRESPYAFLTTMEGFLFSFEQLEKPLNKIYEFPKPIHVFTSSAATRRLIAISGDNMLTQYNFPPSLSQYSQVKLPVGNPPVFAKIRSDVICYSIGDSIYIWNIQNDETIILRAPNNQKVSSLFFSTQTAELYATTQEGSILVWTCTMRSVVSRLGWTNPTVLDCGARIDGAVWSNSSVSFLASCSGRRPLLFRRVELSAVVSGETSVWQIQPDQIMVAGQTPIKAGSTIDRIKISGAYVLVVSQAQAEIFTVRSGGLVPFSRMNPNTSLIDISGETIFDAKGSSLESRNLQGTVKQTTNLGNSIAQFMETNGKFLVVIGSDKNVFLFDISRRAPKIQFTTVFSANCPNYRIRSVAVSCGGFSISVAIDIYEDGCWRPSSDLYLHSPQFDKTVTITFEGRVPLYHYWDREDPRLLCVQTIPFGQNFESTMTGTLVVPHFVADTLETYKQTTLQLDPGKALCTVDLPRIYYQPSCAGVKDPPSYAVLPQFEGLDNADEASKKALMELNFHLATGDIDAAFNAIRGIDNKGIWRSLAQMCAQMRRIDLADLCFGRMEDGGSALLLRKAKESDPEDTTGPIAVVDSQLGLYDEAKQVVKDNRRFDILATIHQSLGDWTDAMSVCNASDRIHLKSIAHQNARSLELRGELNEAIVKYETAGTIANELPRLALQANDVKLLFNYVTERSPAEVPTKILVWVGRFYEAHKQIESALEYFEYANDQRDMVRLMCCVGRWDDAQKLVKKSNQRSVICFYARMLMKRIEYYSQPGNTKPQIDVEKMKHDVIELFRRARQFAQAMDVALTYELIDDILALSFSAPPALVCKAARWFEEQKEAKNAILLYSRAGRLNRALGLCFSMKQYDALDEISDTLNSKTDPNVLIRCGRYFSESERWSKAAQCYALARQFDEVIDLCKNHNIKLQASVIQELSEIKADPEVMKRFAVLCEQQGAFQIAATLYVKFKDHLSAMKALIRSGDSDKVIKFANLIRKKETYILAANYLSTFNPRQGESMFSQIETLYKKAQAPDKLGKFYEATAQVEIDEYQNYQKGLELLRDGLELVNNADSVKDKNKVITLIQKKIQLIEMYLDAQSTVQTDPKHTMQVAVELARNQLLKNVMRLEDVYILMVQANVALGNFKNAHMILEDLRANDTDLTWFMDIDSIKKIYQAVGAEFVPGDGEGGGEEDDYDAVDDDGIDEIEDIEDEIVEDDTE